MPCIARAFARQSRSLRVGESVEWCAHRINKWLIWITLSAKSRRYASTLIKCYNSKILMSWRYDEVNSKLYRKNLGVPMGFQRADYYYQLYNEIRVMYP